MILAALVLASLGLFAILLTAAALVEVYNRVEALSRIAGISDGQRTVELPVLGEQARDYALPLALPGSSGIILFLSPRCAACHSLAQSLTDHVLRDLHIVVTGFDTESGRQWMESHGLASVDNAILDDGAAIADALRISLTPLALIVTDGRFSAAVTVPTPKSLNALVERRREASSRDDERDTTGLHDSVVRKGI